VATLEHFDKTYRIGSAGRPNDVICVPPRSLAYLRFRYGWISINSRLNPYPSIKQSLVSNPIQGLLN
jgi:hypothetical protein